MTKYIFGPCAATALLKEAWAERGVAKINVKGRELSIPVEELEEGR
ncbi:MAG: hypothetical protein U5N86_01275 [Planctomycetota bacterium]|nr:hypothetical protein [Planctomycetota bacterium]